MSQCAAATRSIGFTLIELLVVVAIVVVLAGLLLTAIGLVRDSSRTAACAHNLRQIGIACEAFAEDKEGCYPPAFLTGSPLMTWLGANYNVITKTVGTSAYGGNWNIWTAYLTPYLPSGQLEPGTKLEQAIFKVFQCPASNRRTLQNAAAASGTNSALWNSETALCYGISTGYLGPNACTSAYSVFGFPPGRPGWPGYGLGIPGVNDNCRQRSRLQHPSETIQLPSTSGSPTRPSRIGRRGPRLRLHANRSAMMGPRCRCRAAGPGPAASPTSTASPATPCGSPIADAPTTCSSMVTSRR